MKITIKIDPETLFLIHRLIRDKGNAATLKYHKSVLTELFEIFSRKCIAYTGNANGKPRTLNLRYHLAQEVFSILCEKSLNIGLYERNKLEIFKNELHQKLL